MSAIILLPFGEPQTIPPSDALRNLGDLGTETGITAPARVTAWSGGGRRFAQSSTTGLTATDRSANGTLVLRDATVQALISLKLAGASGAQTIIVRGNNDGTAAERYMYGLEVQEQPQFRGFFEVRWFHQDASGAIQTSPAGVFQHAGDDVEFLLTATRRWESSSRVVVRYYIGDQLLGEFAWSAGDISGGVGAHTIVGARKNGLAYERFLNGVIDQLMVLDVELSAEEIRHTWRRLTEYQPGAVESLVDQLPPGLKWYADPGNDIGKLIKIIGQMYGLVVAGNEEMRALTMPQVASLERVQRWERLCELPVSPGDSLDVRRARIVAAQISAARDATKAEFAGYTPGFVQAALAGPMDLRPDQVQLLEFSNITTDDFSAGIAGERWLDGGGATWSTTSGGELQVTAPSGADLRWESRATSWLMTTREPGRLWVQAKLSSATLPQGAMAALALHNRVTSDWLWFGLWNDAGTTKLVYRIALAGQPAAAPVQVAAIGAGPVWLRISTSQADGWVDDGALTLTYSTVSASTNLFEVPINSGHTRGWGWTGFALTATVAATSSAATATFDDWLLHDRDSVRPFHWYTFRDPALPGRPDMIGADRTVQRIKPAHNVAAAITSKSVIADDPIAGLPDLGPAGAL